MAELEESTYSYPRTPQQKAFPGCTGVHTLTEPQVAVLARPCGHNVTAWEEHNRMPKRHLGGREKNRRLKSPPQNPIKRQSVSITKSHFPFFYFIKPAMLEGRNECKSVGAWGSGKSPQWAEGRNGWRTPTHFKHTHVQFGTVVARSPAVLFYIEIMSFRNHTETAGARRAPPQPWTISLAKPGWDSASNRMPNPSITKYFICHHFYLHHLPQTGLIPSLKKFLWTVRFQGVSMLL